MDVKEYLDKTWKVTWKAASRGPVLADGVINVGPLQILTTLILGSKGPFSTLPQEKYTDKEGNAKYKNLVKISGEKEVYFKIQDWLLEQAVKQDIPMEVQPPLEKKDDIPF